MKPGASEQWRLNTTHTHTRTSHTAYYTYAGVCAPTTTTTRERWPAKVCAAAAFRCVLFLRARLYNPNSRLNVVVRHRYRRARPIRLFYTGQRWIFDSFRVFWASLLLLPSPLTPPGTRHSVPRRPGSWLFSAAECRLYIYELPTLHTRIRAHTPSMLEIQYCSHYSRMLRIYMNIENISDGENHTLELFRYNLLHQIKFHVGVQKQILTNLVLKN